MIGFRTMFEYTSLGLKEAALNLSLNWDASLDWCHTYPSLTVSTVYASRFLVAGLMKSDALKDLKL